MSNAEARPNGRIHEVAFSSELEHMGIDLDLDRAMRRATWEVVGFLVKAKGLAPDEALSLASIAVDFRVSEVVDLTQVVTGYIPKNIFLE